MCKYNVGRGRRGLHDTDVYYIKLLGLYTRTCNMSINYRECANISVNYLMTGGSEAKKGMPTFLNEEKKNKWIKPVSVGGAAAVLIGIGITVVAIRSKKNSAPEQNRPETGEPNGGTPLPITKTKEECAKMLQDFEALRNQKLLP